MQCPPCSATLAAEMTTCSVCGTNLEVLRTIPTLRLEMQATQEQATGMTMPLARFSERLGQLERIENSKGIFAARGGGTVWTGAAAWGVLVSSAS